MKNTVYNPKGSKLCTMMSTVKEGLNCTCVKNYIYDNYCGIKRECPLFLTIFTVCAIVPAVFSRSP